MEKHHTQQYHCLPENTEGRLLRTEEWKYLEVSYQTITADTFLKQFLLIFPKMSLGGGKQKKNTPNKQTNKNQ